ncbi:hypothetical protein H0H92_013678 [Tricholoma furcatifolium]|nr:hypothetical protein H0H92_013678 [Tricholoma furcatifolium]
MLLALVPADVEEFASRRLRRLAVAYEELGGTDPEAEGSGFGLISLLSNFDPLVRIPSRPSTMPSLWVSAPKLAIAKEAGRRLGLGDHMYPAKVLNDGPTPGGQHASLDEMIMDVAGVFPEYNALLTVKDHDLVRGIGV